MAKIVPLHFYRRSTTGVARELLGKILCHKVQAGRVLRGRIVETEAYLGLSDPACHSYGPRRTPRTEVMFQNGGFAYVYFIYGMHFCFNVVTGGPDQPEAVLIRALEPITHTPGGGSLNGPAKLCASFLINKKQNGLQLNREPLWIEDGPPVEDGHVLTDRRIGISHPVARDWPLRFSVKGSVHVSKRQRK